MRDGFAIIPNWLLRDKSLSAFEKLTYVCLTGYTDSDGFCYPSHATLAEQMQISTRTVIRALKTLRERGLVEWVGRVDQDGGQTSNYYRVTTQLLPEAGDTPPMTLSHPPCHTVTPPMTHSHTPYDSQSHEQYPINNTQLTKESVPVEGVTAFKDFWDAYPKKVDRAKAERAYANALHTVSAETLLAGAQAYAQTVADNQTPTRYVLNPATWLNDRRWEDETPAPTPPGMTDNLRAILQE